jgi:predicted RNase H-like nuclease (RuvC/YqgF family)
MSATSRKPCHLVNGLTKLVSLGALALILSAAATIRGQEAAKKDSPAQSQTSQTPELTPQEQIAQLQKKVGQLTAEVTRLRAELAKLEKYKQIDYTRDLMIKEEDRIRSLQSELSDGAAKETALNKRLDEIEKEQNPDRIQRSMAGVGSMRPEEEREAVAHKLSNEKRNIQSQLETLRSTRTRISGLIANAEASISRLKQRLSELSR